MKALSIDCTTSKFGVAAKDGQHLAHLTLDAGHAQSEKLLSAIDFVVKEAGLKPEELDYTAVAKGPGSFTSLRISVSALKALTLVFNTPVYAISSLDSYAYRYRNAEERVLSLIRGNEDRYFSASYSSGKKMSAEEDKSAARILEELSGIPCVILCGPGAASFLSWIPSDELKRFLCFPPEPDSCETLFEMAELMIEKRESALKDYEGPSYVRRSEAELVREEKDAARP